MAKCSWLLLAYIMRKGRDKGCEIQSFLQSYYLPSRLHCNCVAGNSLAMLNNVLSVLFLFFFSIHQVKAQTGTISIGPLLSCGITTFNCPGVSGCCTIGGCCGGGCCANGYTCINEGTSAEACCPAFDSTKCGTGASVSL